MAVQGVTAGSCQYPPALQAPIAARRYLETLLWRDGPVCAHCRATGKATDLKGKSTRPGVYWCNACRKPFSVTVGTIYESSKIPLNTWRSMPTTRLATARNMSPGSSWRACWASPTRRLGSWPVTYARQWPRSPRVPAAIKYRTKSAMVGTYRRANATGIGASRHPKGLPADSQSRNSDAATNKSTIQA